MVNTSNKQGLGLQKSFYWNANKTSKIFILFLLVSKNKFNKIGLEYGLFYHIVKIIQTIVGETDPASKKKESAFKF